MRIRGLGVAVCAGLLIAAAAELDKDEAFIGARRNYWAFRVPVRPDVPALQSAWIQTPIDAFILEALNQKQQAPSPPAAREKHRQNTHPCRRRRRWPLPRCHDWSGRDGRSKKPCKRRPRP